MENKPKFKPDASLKLMDQVCQVQELMGHADVKTTEIYPHVMEKNFRALASPLDHLGIRVFHNCERTRISAANRIYIPVT